jgi:hypothetical protein
MQRPYWQRREILESLRLAGSTLGNRCETYPPPADARSQVE